MKKEVITAVIMAGGQGSRMNGQDKGLVLFKEKPLFQHLITCLESQANDIIINANRNLNIYRQSGYPVFCDLMPGYLGPLAAIQSGLYYSTSAWSLFVSCDMPFIPDNLIQRLWQQKGKHLAAYVHDGMYEHPTLLLIHKRLLQPLSESLKKGNLKLLLFLKQIPAKAVDFSDYANNFININTLAELDYWNSK